MVSNDFRALKIALGPLKKIKKKIVFNTYKPLLQHPLCGILRRAGPKNGQNGPSSFQENQGRNLRQCPKSSYVTMQSSSNNDIWIPSVEQVKNLVLLMTPTLKWQP